MMQLLVLNSMPVDLGVEVSGCNTGGICNSITARLYNNSDCSGSASQTLISLKSGSYTKFPTPLSSGVYTVQISDTVSTRCSNAVNMAFLSGSGGCTVVYNTGVFASISCIN
ncbi:hypothetical protein [Leptospira ainazelensis]|uniref:hypothetical protein n=1 Tax=Leptospira ainazelensis TaxID=2810034 RepID=UPI0019652C6B|nr:hypothetical protein [Leptospira ainazelensis]